MLPQENQKRHFPIIRIKVHRYLIYEGLFFLAVLLVLAILYLRLPVTYESKSAEIKPDTSLALKFKRPTSKSIKYRIEPQVPGKWHVKGLPLWVTGIEFVPEDKFTPGKKYQIIVDDIRPVVPIGSKPLNKIFSLKIQDPPEVVSIQPSDKSLNINIDSKIIVILNRANSGLRKLKVESNLPIKNPYPYSTDDTTFLWDYSQNLERNKVYTYKIIDENQQDEEGTVIASNSFTTVPGEVEVISMYPQGNGIEVNSNISLNFNQEVERDSAEKAFFISPNTGGGFSWDGNKMTFTPRFQSYQTRYSYGINPGVKAVYGLPSVSKSIYAYTTDYSFKKLSVPAYRQSFALSCEESALRMALAYRGIYVSDWDILQKVSYSPRPRDTLNNIWDDPFLMYVGDVNGKMGITGWGAYASPIASAARSYGRSADAVTGIGVKQLAQSIYDDNPVVLWGYLGSEVTSDSWLTEEGKLIQAPKNTHVRLVYGVKGDLDNPVGFYLHDPIYGNIYWSKYQLEQNMTFAGSLSSQAVIVR